MTTFPTTAAVSGSGSTLGITRVDIFVVLGRYFEYGRNPAVWSEEELSRIEDITRSGENTFYNPPGHSWSFLRPRLALSIVANTADYDLPDDFGGFLDQYLSFVQADNKFESVLQTSVPLILKYRQNENLIVSIQSMLFAVNVKVSSNTEIQGSEVLLFPTPKQDGTLEGTYYSTPNAISDNAPFPLGGQPHSETLLAACMAAAELEKTKQQGPLAAKYQERLAASIQFDRRTGPKHLGYNGDRSPGQVSIYDLRQSSITRNGVAISGW